jgi:hypothetical protein
MYSLFRNYRTPEEQESGAVVAKVRFVTTLNQQTEQALLFLPFPKIVMRREPTAFAMVGGVK